MASTFRLSSTVIPTATPNLGVWTDTSVMVRRMMYPKSANEATTSTPTFFSYSGSLSSGQTVGLIQFIGPSQPSDATLVGRFGTSFLFSNGSGSSITFTPQVSAYVLRSDGTKIAASSNVGFDSTVGVGVTSSRFISSAVIGAGGIVLRVGDRLLFEVVLNADSTGTLSNAGVYVLNDPTVADYSTTTSGATANLNPVFVPTADLYQGKSMSYKGKIRPRQFAPGGSDFRRGLRGVGW